MKRLARFSLLFGALTLLAVSASAAPVTFQAPELIPTLGDRPQLSRNARGNVLFNTEGRLQLLYWDGGETTAPSSPSYVYHQEWTRASGWSSETSVADSFQGPTYVGGRHPNAALGVNGDLWVVWHDHRDATIGAPGNSNNNIEIYADRKPLAGGFSATDIRLTTSSAATLGDNGYVPRIASGPDGRLTVLWYDYHFDVGTAELLAIRSDVNQVFPATASMASLRLTDAATRAPNVSYTVPDLAVDAAGVAHAVWSTGTGGPAPLLYAIIPDPIGPMAPPVTLAAQTGGFFDPARLVAAPSGDVWVVYTDEPAGASDIRARRKPAASTEFEAPITLAGGAALQQAPSLVISTEGDLHAVWVDERDGRRVHYGRFSTSGALLQETALTEPGNWQRPSLALDADGDPHIVAELVGVNTSQLWLMVPEVTLHATEWQGWQ